MLCSKCSREVRPVVALDIDGTLGDYHGHFLPFAENWLDRHWSGKGYNGSQVWKEWICEIFQIDLRTFRDMKLAYRQGGQKRLMPMYEGASQLTRAIRDAGAEVWLTTTRPYLRLDNIDPDTREWCKRNGITYDFLLYGEDKYAVLAERVESHRVVAALDDLEPQLVLAQEAFGPDIACQRGTFWNKGLPWPQARVEDLDEAAVYIRDKITRWKEQHDG